MKIKEKKTKPTPINCVCGKAAVVTVFRDKKMISCPNPAKCSANLRTLWKSHMEEAVLEWNAEASSFQHAGR